MIATNKNIFPGEPTPVLEIVPGAFHELVLKRVRLYSRRRIAWLRKIWTELNSSGEPFNSHAEVDGYLQEVDIPSMEKEWMANDPLMMELGEGIKETEWLLLNDQYARLTILTNIFGLSPAENDVLQLCLAISLDPNLGRVYAYLQDNSARAYATETLAARLFGHGYCLLLNADAPLKKWSLVTETIPSPGEPARLECDPFIKNWLMGLDELDEVLNEFSRFQPLKESPGNWPVKKAVSFIKRMVNDEVQNKVRIFVAGAEGSGRRSFAAIICDQFGLLLLTLQTDRIPEHRWQQVYLHAQRQAFLSGTALAWYGTNPWDRFWPQNIPSYYLQFIVGEAGSFIQPENGWVDMRIELPLFTFEERLKLWRQFVPKAASWPTTELEEMALRHQATIGQIVSIGQKMVSTIPEAYEALRAGARHRLGQMAQQVNSDFTWNDLVVPGYIKRTMEDFIFEATERIHFWEQPAANRLFPQGKSLIALFTGDPGTGKTMAAQVIAASLKLDLFRIDLSTVVSKYIGESSKNIEQILSRAKTLDLVLLFDEADALFGKRTDIKDAHDRYANTDTNYLLQAIEEYPGIIILASNKKSNIDTGFMRRFRYLLEFPKPEAKQRLQLWRNILNELAGDQASLQLDDELIRISQLVEITGAQIKLSILSALFMARRDKTAISLSHLLKGLERELTKEGRGLGRQLQESINY